MGLFGKKEKDIIYPSIIHVGGLNVPDYCACKVVLGKINLTIICAGNEFILDIKKIRNVDFQMDIDEKQFIKSSLTKGVIGAAAFGVSGAIIGSAPKTKTKREVKCYAIISYENSNGEYKSIVLRDELPNTSQCAKLVDALKMRIKAQVNRVEL